ncbi:hypothetical protein [Qipengyuania sp. JC766]|uniref:hypothetical protein n=1 Tax=Qipengyuania sp. JC766 TaxID=3232139 RepID=UPI00345789FB
MGRIGLATAIALAGLLAACGDGSETAVDDTSDNAASAPAAISAAPTPGSIAGQLSYPSDYLPEDLTVCARNETSGEEYCERRAEGADSYRIEVPAGSYTVWASTADYGADYRAYYSNAVPCGLSVDCPDHDPIVVEVGAGEARTGIDPADWYAR